MDEDTFGPYTAKQIQELQLMDDIKILKIKRFWRGY